MRVARVNHCWRWLTGGAVALCLLGFFVWMMGGSIDRLFFSTSLPNPPFGTPGLLWASLTLALLLVLIILALNLLAMILRHRIRERYRALMN